ncbi:MAG TPA: S16 family serine protease [Sporichthyaceae bacterium]|nr:S16 family serine protease [Sporichthyaceae bacterium]
MLKRVNWSSPRTISLTVASVLLAVLAGFLLLLPVPYARLAPGPATDTLGESNGKPLIVISGHDAYPPTGHLDMTTVSITNPDHRMTLIEALSGWFSSGVAVVPKETVYDTSKSAAQIDAENTQEMELSQKHATAAALLALHIPGVISHVVVSALTSGTPAYGKLMVADEIEKIDGKVVNTPQDVVDDVRVHKPGEQVTFLVKRKDSTGNEQELTEVVTTAKNPGDPKLPYVGISPDRDYTFPFQVKIELDNVGGPSAGMMFALGIIERLTQGGITGGKTIAGTGTITDDGVVGKIGGIQMKILGAKRAGATVFLVPADNCRDAVQGPPKGIELVRVDKLSTALSALQAIRTGQGTVPHC